MDTKKVDYKDIDPELEKLKIINKYMQEHKPKGIRGALAFIAPKTFKRLTLSEAYKYACKELGIKVDKTNEGTVVYRGRRLKLIKNIDGRKKVLSLESGKGIEKIILSSDKNDILYRDEDIVRQRMFESEYADFKKNMSTVKENFTKFVSTTLLAGALVTPQINFKNNESCEENITRRTAVVKIEGNAKRYKGNVRRGMSIVKMGNFFEEFLEKEEAVEESVIATKVSQAGLNFIANREVGRRNLIMDENNRVIKVKQTCNNTTIGYGYDITRDPLNLGIRTAVTISAGDALELLRGTSDYMADKIVNSPHITRELNQQELDALVALRYNIGSLGVVDGLIDAINEDKSSEEIQYLIDDFYDDIVKSNPACGKYRKGWQNRTDATMAIYAHGHYGEMAFDIFHQQDNNIILEYDNDIKVAMLE